MSLTIVWAYSDECGCTALGSATVESVDAAAAYLAEHGIHDCDALVFEGTPLFDRWDNESPLSKKFMELHCAQLEAGERREYERLKAKYQP